MKKITQMEELEILYNTFLPIYEKQKLEFDKQIKNSYIDILIKINKR
jgi:hypothetical protein